METVFSVGSEPRLYSYNEDYRPARIGIEGVSLVGSRVMKVRLGFFVCEVSVTEQQDKRLHELPKCSDLCSPALSDPSGCVCLHHSNVSVSTLPAGGEIKRDDGRTCSTHEITRNA
jgi:hypothetical protein